LFYTRDHLDSIRELVDSTGSTRARYDYDSYGRTTKVSGDKDPSFSFTGLYAHAASGLLLTYYRNYDSNLGRWLSEDPTGILAGIDLMAYVHNSPTMSVDPLGLSDLVFEKAGKILTLYDYNGEPVARYPAGNITIRPNGDPNTVGSNGPAPSGYFPLQKPVNTAGRPEYGAYFFPVGAVDKKGRPADIARKRGIGVHAGRKGPESPTQGCIRVGDKTIRELVDWNKIDPIRTITIE